MQLSKSFTEFMEKSFNNGGHLVRHQVQVKKKDGTTYMATRWIDPTSNQAHHFGGKYKHEKDIPGATPTEKFDAVINGGGFKQRSERHRALMSLGVYDAQQHGLLLGDSAYANHLQKKELTEHDFKRFHHMWDSENVVAADTPVPQTPEGKVDYESSEFDINELRDNVRNKDFEKIKKEQKEFLKQKYNIDYKVKWETYKLSLDQIMITGRPKSLIAYGTGGVGKTWELEKSLEANNVRVYDEELHLDPSEYDAVVISGNTSPSDMYNILYTNKEKLVIFDDCDSMWGNEDAENILKKALDTSGDNNIRYANPKPVSISDDGVKIYPPKQFKFTGQIIFISNMRREQLPQPIVDSRARTIDLSMSMSETLEKLDDIKDKMRFYDKNGDTMPVTREQKQAVIDFLNEHKQYIDLGKVNGRTLGNLAMFALTLAKRNNNVWNKQIQDDFNRRAAILLDIA